MRNPYLIAATLLACATAQAEIVSKPIDYKIGDTEFASTLVYDDSVKTARPGLVMIPNWYGAGPASVAKAKAIAGKDYVILVADVFGADVRPANDDEAGKAIGVIYKDRGALRVRVNTALQQLRGQAGDVPLDLKHIGAIGFCFGGAAALDLARSGADVAGVVTFHGNLATDDANLAKNIKGSVLVLNGADDSYTGPDAIASFQKEMNDAKVDWQFVNYSGAVHCFTEPSEKSAACAYNERTAKRSYQAMHTFFDEVFAK